MFTDAERTKILRLHEADGLSVRIIAERFGKKWPTIWKVIREERAKRLHARAEEQRAEENPQDTARQADTRRQKRQPRHRARP
jgi:transposase